jgi:hypothetical protein
LSASEDREELVNSLVDIGTYFGEEDDWDST